MTITLTQLEQAAPLVIEYRRLLILRQAVQDNPDRVQIVVHPGSGEAMREPLPANRALNVVDRKIDDAKAALTALGVVVP